MNVKRIRTAHRGRGFVDAASPFFTHLAVTTRAMSKIKKAPEISPFYTGPLSAALKKLKFLSLSSCAATVLSTPVLFCMESGIGMTGRIAFSSLVLLAGVGSTGLIHFFTKTYVHRMYLPQATRHETREPSKVVLETFNFIGRPKFEEIDLSKVTTPNTARPFVSFADADKKMYFCHHDVLTATYPRMAKKLARNQ
eukprot:CFRG0005T1